MTRTTARTATLLCPAMGLLLVLGTLASRPVLASAPAPAASSQLVEPAARATSTASGTVVNVKVRPGASATLHANRLQVSGAADAEAASLASLPATGLFDRGSSDRDAFSATTDARSLQATTDLDAWYALTVPAGIDVDALVRRLSADPNVESAYVNPTPLDPTADYTGAQLYRAAAPTGIGQAAAARVAGGAGEYVHIFDIEGNWNLTHEDLKAANVTFLQNGTFDDPFTRTSTPDLNRNHGTAVLGELIGNANGFGVTGIVPKAAVSVVNATTTQGGQIPQAIRLATAHAKPGDVILIEQQYDRDPGSGTDFVPVEYYAADYDAIKAAVAKGVIVVEAAANGRNSAGNNLDTLLDRPDSGAIMVGAGQVAGCATWGPGSAARSRAAFSNYGTTVDLQGPGECVVTTGYGDLAAGANANSWYTDSFSGTSSASPVVTGAAAALSSIIEARTGKPATPAEVRALLIKTGTPQDTSVAGHIGPMPNLAKAIAALATTAGQGGQTGDTTAPTVTGPVAKPGTGFSITGAGRVPTQISWGAKDASGIARFAVKVSTDGAAWTDVTLAADTSTKATLDLSPGHHYQFIVAAKDTAGNWSAWRKGPVFTPTLDPDTDANLAYEGSWTRRSWDAATNGAVTATSTRGDTVTIDFHGQAVGWIASRGTTRGQAHVWLDGKDMGVVNLYSTTTQARAIAFAATVSTGSTHELVIQAIGTIDVDGLVFLG